MNQLPNKIKELRKQKNLTQADLGDILKVGKTTISNYETGYSTPDSVTLITLANLFEVSIDYLIGRSSSLQEDIKIEYKNFTRVHVYSKLEAEKPVFLNKNIVDFIDISDVQTNGGDFFALIVKSDCMNRIKIFPKDIVLVRRQDMVEDGAIAVVWVQSEGTFIRIYYQNGKYATLAPDSTDKNFELKIYNTNETEIEILGKVVIGIIKF